AVHRPAVPGLEPRGIDEHELIVLAGQHGVYPVARGLGLARDDGHLGADQGIGQRRLPHVRAPHDRDESTAKRLAHFFSWATATGRDSWAGLRLRRRPPRTGPSASMAPIACPAAS